MKTRKLAVLCGIIAVTSVNARAQKTASRDYVHPRSPLVESGYAELPAGSIKAKGWLLRQLELQAEGATGRAEELYPEPDNLGPDSDWLGGKGKGWERPPYYVKGLVTLAYILDDKELKEKARKWIEWTLNSQQESGLFGPREMKDWWPRMPMLYAVKTYYEATGDKRVIPFFDKYFKYQLENLSSDPLRDWSKSRAGDNIEIVLWLYNQTGEDYLLKLASLLEKQAYPWKDIYTNNLFYHFGDDFHTKHSVSVGQALKFPALSYQLTGDESYKQAFHKGIEHLVRDHGQSSGIVSGTEFLAGKSSIQGVETCTVVEWLQSLETAARIIDDPQIGDRLEKIAYNALPAQLSRDIKSHLYYSQPNQILCKYGPIDFDQGYAEGILLSPYSGMGCCRYNMHMGWPYFVKNSWAATPDKGLAIIAYAPTEVSAVVGENVPVRIVEETNYPFDEQIKLEITLSKPAEFPLRLRIPAWCKSPQVKVNGKKVNGITSGKIALIKRQWKTGDEVVLNFPMEINIEQQVNNSVSVERGPLVYALKIGTNYVSRKEHPVSGFHDYEVYPTTPWNYGLVFDRKNLAASFTVEKSRMSENPFVQAETPVKLKVKAQLLPDWKMAYKGMYAFEVPYAPLTSPEPIDEVTLIPFGAENIRISCFPEIGIPGKSPSRFTASFDDNKMKGWIWYGGGWFAKDGALHNASNHGSWGAGIHGSKAVLPSVTGDNFIYETTLKTGAKGNAGVIFRVTNPSIGADLYEGYYVGINPESNRIEMGKASGQKYILLGTADLKVNPEKKYKLKVKANGDRFEISLDNSERPLLTVNDSEFKNGMIGVRSYDALPVFDDLKFENLAAK